MEDRAGDRKGERSIGQGACCDAGVVESREIVPVTRQALAATALLAAEDVDSGCLLPEGSLRQHDVWLCLRKNDVGQVRGRITDHRADPVGFAG